MSYIFLHCISNHLLLYTGCYWDFGFCQSSSEEFCSVEQLTWLDSYSKLCLLQWTEVDSELNSFSFQPLPFPGSMESSPYACQGFGQSFKVDFRAPTSVASFWDVSPYFPLIALNSILWLSKLIRLQTFAWALSITHNANWGVSSGKKLYKWEFYPEQFPSFKFSISFYLIWPLSKVFKYLLFTYCPEFIIVIWVRVRLIQDIPILLEVESFSTSSHYILPTKQLWY